MNAERLQGILKQDYEVRKSTTLNALTLKLILCGWISTNLDKLSARSNPLLLTSIKPHKLSQESHIELQSPFRIRIHPVQVIPEFYCLA